MPGAFDGAGQLALIASIDAGLASRPDLAFRGQETLEKVDVFVIDLQRLIRFKRIDFRLAEITATAAATLLGSLLGSFITFNSF